MIFVDTSAIYAWSDRSDRNHTAAVESLTAILDSDEPMLTHNYVVLESFALLQARLGVSIAAKFAKDCEHFKLDWVDRELHRAAVRELEKSGKRQLSLVDHISFLVMSHHHVQTAFAFDSDFVSRGFRLFH
jgi:predicted nucleic acid-binding protein